MAVVVALLRGINVGSHNRIAMPALRDALADAGFPGARTYVQSGNIVLDSDRSAALVADGVRDVISARFDLSIPVVVRTRDELASVVALNPLRDVATEPKRYQVSFLAEPPARDVLERLNGLAAEPERLVAVGRELYAWHPDGVARSKLWEGLAGKKLGVLATARNWTTVTMLLEMADASV